jgi:hydrogenase nickel incorporation protein HypA/HybF
MHEARLVRDLVAEIDRVASQEHVDRVDTVRIEIGALSHVTPDSLTGTFELLAHGSLAQDAHLDITRSSDQTAAYAHDVRLVSVSVEDG